MHRLKTLKEYAERQDENQGYGSKTVIKLSLEGDDNKQHCQKPPKCQGKWEQSDGLEFWS